MHYRVWSATIFSVVEICWKYVEAIFNVCPKTIQTWHYWYNPFRIWPVSARWLPKTSLFVEILSKSCLNFVQYLLNIYFSKTVPTLSKSGIFCRNLFKIWPVPIKQKPTIKIFLTLSKVSSKYVQNMFKINLRPV